MVSIVNELARCLCENPSDVVAWRDFCKVVYPIIYGCVVVDSVSAEDAEDAVQEAFIEFSRAISSIQSPKAALSWIRTVAKNKLADVRRKHRHREYARAANHLVMITDRSLGPDDVAEIEDDKKKLLRLLSRLSADYRNVIALKYFIGMSSDEMAVELKCSPVAARKRLFDAMAALRRLFGVHRDPGN